jgi:hypothetical protein
MTNIDRAEDQQSVENDIFERQLAAALRVFAGCEPRAGLEDRVRAGLRVGRKRQPSWNRWLDIAAATLAIASILLVAPISEKRSQKLAAVIHSTAPVRKNPVWELKAAAKGMRSHPGLRAGHAVKRAVALPRLQQFPSPQPLSEQERILANYVIKNRKQAVLIARARMASLKQDLVEEFAPPATNSNELLNQQGEDKAR